MNTNRALNPTRRVAYAFVGLLGGNAALLLFLLQNAIRSRAYLLAMHSVTNQLVGIYDKHFTADEIKDLLEFYGSPLGQKVATEMPKITREAQLATRTAGNQAARLAWQQFRTEYPNAGENFRAFNTRRRNPNANAAVPPQSQPPGTQQALGDSQQP